MKITIRSPQQLQRKIDRAVRHVEKAGQLFYDWGGDRAPTGYRTHLHLREIYNVIAKSKEPLDYHAVTERVGLPHTTNIHFHVANRLGHLATRGYLKHAGYKYTPYYKNGIGAQVFSAVPVDQIPIVQRRVQKAIDQMLREVEVTAYQVNDVTACLAQRIKQVGYTPKERAGHPVAVRNAEIVRLRLGGTPLQQIGQKFGITRERVRQIFEIAVSGHDHREDGRIIGRRRTLDYDEVNRTIRQIKALGRHPKERGILLDVSKAILRMPHIWEKGARQNAKDKARAGDEQLALDIIKKRLEK